MNSNEELLDVAALIKFKNSEPLSPADAHRVINIFARAQFIVSAGNQQEGAQIQTRLQSVLQQKYFQPNK